MKKKNQSRSRTDWLRNTDQGMVNLKRVVRINLLIWPLKGFWRKNSLCRGVHCSLCATVLMPPQTTETSTAFPVKKG